MLTILHGMNFGGLYLLACSGAFIELYRAGKEPPASFSAGSERFLRGYLLTMSTLAWIAVLTGAYMLIDLI